MKTTVLLACMAMVTAACGPVATPEDASATLEDASPVTSISPSTTIAHVDAITEASGPGDNAAPELNAEPRSSTEYCDEVTALSRLWIDTQIARGVAVSSKLEGQARSTLEAEYSDHLVRVIETSPDSHREFWQVQLEWLNGSYPPAPDNFQNSLWEVEDQCYEVGSLNPFHRISGGMIIDVEYEIDMIREDPPGTESKPLAQDYCESVASLARVLPVGMGPGIMDDPFLEPSPEIAAAYAEQLERVIALHPAEHAEIWRVLAEPTFGYASLDVLEEGFKDIDTRCHGVVLLVLQGNRVFDYFSFREPLTAVGDE